MDPVLAPIPAGCLQGFSSGGAPITTKLAYQLMFQDDISKDRNKLTNSEMDQFLSIGVQHVAKNYGVSEIGWSIQKNSCDENSYFAVVTSPWSETISSAESSPVGRISIAKIDKGFTAGSQYKSNTYKWRFHAIVVASPGVDDPKLINLSCILVIDLQRKNTYASDEHYAAVTHTSEKSMMNLTDTMEKEFLSIYVAAMRAQGLKVNQGPEGTIPADALSVK